MSVGDSTLLTKTDSHWSAGGRRSGKAFGIGGRLGEAFGIGTAGPGPAGAGPGPVGAAEARGPVTGPETETCELRTGRFVRMSNRCLGSSLLHSLEAVPAPLPPISPQVAPMEENITSDPTFSDRFLQPIKHTARSAKNN